MDFNHFIRAVSKITDLPLPAEVSQFKMSPPFRKALIDIQKDKIERAKQSAVLALFYPDHLNMTKLILILRKSYKGVHSAQVGFPGGKVEKKDRSLKFTALRETQEEIGVPMDNVEILKAMTQVYIPPSNYFVHPFIGYTDRTPEFVKEEKEVEDLIEVPLTSILDDKNVITQTVSTSYKLDVTVPAFLFEGHVVWGATAMMLSEIKDLLKQSL